MSGGNTNTNGGGRSWADLVSSGSSSATASSRGRPRSRVNCATSSEVSPSPASDAMKGSGCEAPAPTPSALPSKSVWAKKGNPMQRLTIHEPACKTSEAGTSGSAQLVTIPPKQASPAKTKLSEGVTNAWKTAGTGSTCPTPLVTVPPPVPQQPSPAKMKLNEGVTNVWKAAGTGTTGSAHPLVIAPPQQPTCATIKFSEVVGSSMSTSVGTNGLIAGSSSTSAIKKTGGGDEQTEVSVTEINPKLTLIGTKDVDKTKQRPLRPKESGPRKGTNIVLRANHFPVSVQNVPLKVYHYDVVITPKDMRPKSAILVGDGIDEGETTVPDRVLPVIWKEFETRNYRTLGARMPFDGKKNVYSAKPLKLGPSNVWIDELKMRDPDDDEKTRTFRIQLKLANEVSTASMWTYLRSSNTAERCELPQEVIQALDVALRYSPSLLFTPCNRSFYSSEKPYDISPLLELWFGHNQSLLLGRDCQATLNIDMANKAFIKQLSLSKVAEMLLKKSTAEMSYLKWNDKQYREMENFLKGKLIQYGTGPQNRNGSYEREHRFVAVKIMNTSAKTYSFTINGESNTISQHFEQKGVQLKHPDWPVVHVGNKNMTNYVPLELCRIVPQAYKGKLGVDDTSKMIKGAATEPTERFKRIQNSKSLCKFENCPILKEFGLDVGQNMLEIKSARKLARPEIHSKTDRGRDISEQPRYDDGKFQIGQFLKGAEVPKVGVFNAFGGWNDEIKDFMKKLGQEAFARGMKGSNGQSLQLLFESAEMRNAKARMVKGSETFNEVCRGDLAYFKSKGCELVIVVMSKDGKEYSAVKNEAEVQVGILTQCIRSDTITKIVKRPDTQGKQVLINILLKVNAKLNGVSFQLGQTIRSNFGFDREPIIFLGADVTHPAPNSKSPSVAAITASYDLSGMCYSMHISVQASTKEVIEQLAVVVKDMIVGFRAKTGRPPKRIIMFRDGVSEGQFSAIKEIEYRGIVEACRMLSITYKPPITFLVVKKRHHTRFMPVNMRDAVKPKNNIPPGTVVDTVITHPTEMEYFLNSHVGIQGTSKPTRYHVIHDDSNFSMDALEELTYFLCYTFVRCTHPVSYPAPTYYAHLAAFRARALLEKEGENADLQTLQTRMTVQPDLLKKYPMFFV